MRGYHKHLKVMWAWLEGALGDNGMHSLVCVCCTCSTVRQVGRRASGDSLWGLLLWQGMGTDTSGMP